MQKSSKKQKISRFDLRILDIMGVSDSCQTTCLVFKVKKKTLWGARSVLNVLSIATEQFIWTGNAYSRRLVISADFGGFAWF